MSILIKGMEMPVSCRECPLEMFYINVGITKCRATTATLAEDYKPILFDGRASNCPLVPVPPHGRLIDADALEPDTDWFHGCDGFTAFSKLAIECAPTIIEGEE